MKFKKPKIKRSPDKAIERIETIANFLKGPGQVKVGLPKGSGAYPDGTDLLMVGAVHEFGSESRGVPERSYLRSTVTENRRKYKRLLRKLGAKIATGEMSADNALKLLGLKLESDVKMKLTNLSEPPLKHREGNPLIDTGLLRQSIRYVVGE